MDLKAARRQKGWSQSDLEKRTSVAAHNISALETGSRDEAGYKGERRPRCPRMR